MAKQIMPAPVSAWRIVKNLYKIIMAKKLRYSLFPHELCARLLTAMIKTFLSLFKNSSQRRYDAGDYF